jgi:hypothetical protein
LYIRLCLRLDCQRIRKLNIFSTYIKNSPTSKHGSTFYPENREETTTIPESKIKQVRNTVAQLDLLDKAELCAIKVFVKRMVGEETYNKKVDEIYQRIKCE